MDEETVYYEGSPLLGSRPEKVFLLAVVGHSIFLIAPILLKFINQAIMNGPRPT